MPYCHNCGGAVSQDDAYCAGCGADLSGGDGEQGQSQSAQSGATGRAQQPGQPANGQPQQGQQGQPQQGQPAPRNAGAQTSRRNLLKYGAAGGIALAGAGGAWYLTSGSGDSGPTVVDDFEGRVVDGWQGDTGFLTPYSDSVAGEQAANLAFGSGTEIWREIPETTPSEISFWWQTGAVEDNEFTVWFHDLTAEETPSMDNAHFGFEVGAGHNRQVVTAPPFRNEPGYEVLTTRPRSNVWYKTRFTDIDYVANTFDVELLDSTEEVVGTVRDVAFAGDPDSIDAIHVRNHMNFSRAPARLDQVVLRE